MANEIVARGSLIEEFVHYPVALNQVVAVGDMVYFDGTTVKPASDFTWDSSDVQTRREFKAKFAGIACDAHLATDGACLLKVASVCEADATITSTTVSVGDLVGPEDESSLLVAQKLVKVVDPAEAVGIVVRKYGTVTTCRVQFFGTKGGTAAIRTLDSRVLTFTQSTLAVGTLVGTAAVEKLFGGGIQVLELGFIESASLSGTADLIAKITSTGGDTSTLTVGTTGAAAGRFTTADLTASSNTILYPGDVFRIQATSRPTTGNGTWVVRYRPLS
jgi:hypothetical protein